MFEDASYAMNNQVVNPNLSSTNTFLRGSNIDNNQSFVNQNQMMSQQIPSEGYGAQRSTSGKWSSQFENPLAFDPSNSMSSKPSNPLNNASNSTYMMNNSSNFATTSTSQVPMSTSMKIMQAVLPRHAVRPSSSTGPSQTTSSFDNPRPLRGRGGFPRGESSFIGRKRERSRSKSPLIRSRSPSSSDRHPRGRGRGRGSSHARDVSPISTRPPKKPYSSRSPPGARGSTSAARASSPPPATTSTSNKFDSSSLSARELVEDIHLPAILKHAQSVTIFEILSKFPKLYIPADFTDLKIDWLQISEAIVYDYFFNISSSIPIVFENTPTTLHSTSSITGKDSEEKEEKSDIAVGNNSAISCWSDILEPSKFSFATSNTVNNMIVEHPVYVDRFVNETKPVKFNAKVLVCCGLKDPETERIDHNYCRKLRYLFSIYLPFLPRLSLNYGSPSMSCF